MLKLLEVLLHGLVAAMQAPANYEGELHVELPEWLTNSA
jgi:methylaspartate ammonia-lyase